jgi:hypothetical protein
VARDARLEVEPPVVRVVGSRTATVAVRAQSPVHVAATLTATGVRISGRARDDGWRFGPQPTIVRFELSPEARGYIEGHWRLRVPGADPARPLDVPVRATTHPGPRLRAVGPRVIDVGAIPLDAELSWRLRNEGGRPARLHVRELVGPARLRGPGLRLLPALTATTVDVRLALGRPGPFEVRARVETGASAIELALVGEGVAPALRANPSRLEFSRLVVGGEASREVTLANVGGGQLRVDDVRLSPGAQAAFRWTWIAPPNPGPSPWQVGDAPLRARVYFAPNAPGPYARELRVVHAVGVTTIPLRGSARSCEEACPIAHGLAGCVAGRCGIERCDPGYFDVNGAVEDGCECADPSDAGPVCATAIDLGRIEEQSAARIVDGRIPTPDDVDLVRFHADDGFHVFRERFDVHVELRSDSTDLELCVFRRPTDEPRPACVLSDPHCPRDGHVRFEGTYGREDAADFVVRIRPRARDSAPSCTPYRLIVRNG